MHDYVFHYKDSRGTYSMGVRASTYAIAYKKFMANFTKAYRNEIEIIKVDF